MKINSISTNLGTQNLNKQVDKTKEKNKSTIPNHLNFITFKSGNPKHIAHVVAEEPLFGFNGGGVGTVSNDYNFLDNDVEKLVKIIPLYNQEVVYEKGIDKNGNVVEPLTKDVKVRYIPNNLPADHPFKKHEGSPFVTSKNLNKSTDIVKFLADKDNVNNVFVLEEVKSDKMDWGFEKDVNIKMFKAKKEGALVNAMNKRAMSPELQNKMEFIFTYVDSTASMAKQYADGSYSTATGDELTKKFSAGWSGQAYAKYNKATVELLPALQEKYNIDPKYLLCSDGQSMFTMHYAAQKNAEGNQYWLDKFLGGVGHNMNAGYDQPMGARQAIVNLGASKEDLEKLINSKEYIEALKLGNEEQFLRETVLKNFNKDYGMNAFSVPIHYAKAGYVPMLTTVSEGYHDSIISNDLVSSMYKDLKELDEIGKFKGLTNVLMDPNVSPFKKAILQAGYNKECKLKLADGSEVTIKPFEMFKEGQTDLKTVREIKRQNKINLLERFDKKYLGAQCFNAQKNEWGKPNSGRMEILTGASSRNAKIYGEINPQYIEKLKKGEDIKLIVSWGRGDFQKGMDTVIDTFEKYAQKDPNAVLLFGGDMANEPKTVEKFQLVSSKPEMKGRMILMDGWTPGKDFAYAGDVALLPSRFAPCELTDLEAKKALCTPVVPNVQGMAQKNFDPSIEKDKALMDGYKGKHEYFMSEETAYEAANENAKKEFKAVKDRLVNTIKNRYKGQINEEIPDKLLKQTIESNNDYNNALRKLRDSVISDELAETLERALITDRNSENAEKILANQVKADTTWFGNSWMSKTNKSSGQLYFDYHFNNKGKNISKSDLIKLDFENLHSADKLDALKNNKKFKMFAGITAGVLALASLGYAGYKSGILSPVFDEKKENGHLSRIG